MGFTGRVFTFDATESNDPDGDPMTLKCRWDFNSDGQWDSNFSTDRIINHIFTETGTARIRLEVQDQDDLTDTVSDSIYLYEPVPDSVFVDSRDQQHYRTVKLGGKWWMSENLRYGIRIHSSEPQTNNGVVEYYAYDNDPSHVPVCGGMYSWEEMMNYTYDTINRGICPEGWRVPTLSDWQSINIMAPLQFVVDYYGPDGLSGFNLQFSGHHSTAPRDPPYTAYFDGLDVTGSCWSTKKRFLTRCNTLVKLFYVINIHIPIPKDPTFGFLICDLGDHYVFYDTTMVIHNTTSTALRCVKD